MNSALKRLHQFGWNEWLDAQAEQNGLTERRLASIIAMACDQFIPALSPRLNR